MTTENVTVLFTDIVGSTALAASMTPEAADELRREHFVILRQAVAEAGGTEVKQLGDGFMVVFPAASAALSCAVAMQQGVELNNRGHDYSVGLRVGLSAGEVVPDDDDDYFGDPVIEAARLCARCASGQVLAADIVRLTAGRRSRHECRSLGDFTLKGLSEPVETVEVLWEPLVLAEGGAVIPLPGRLAVRPATGVVGREVETAAMLDACERVAGGGGREVFLVSGEAGLGKTTLVAATARAAFDSGAWVLFGHCEEDLATPYQLFAEALGHFVTHASEEQLVAHVESHGSALVPLVPALARRLPGLPPSTATDGDGERYQLFAAVVGLVAVASDHQPLVVVLEDLQWADRASLQLLAHVITADEPMRLLVLGTYRDTELSRSHPLVETLAALHRQHSVVHIELAGLDDTDVMSLMEAAAGHTLEGAAIGLAHAVQRETDGNPFFVSEVLRHLAETGAISQDPTGRLVARDTVEQIALPASIRAVIGARVGRLGPDAERMLSFAAVIGRDFDLAVLARAAQTSEDQLLDILDAAIVAALVRELTDTPGHYNFAHALIQHTLYADMGLTRQARAHRRVAEALEALYGDRPGERVGELARHWINAQPIDLAKALDYSRRAADAARDALAPADALRYYTQALELYAQSDHPDPTLGIDLAVGLGTAQRQTGDPAFRDTLLDAARRAADLDDTDRLVAAALANYRGFFSNGGKTDADKVEILELALDRLASQDPRRALVLASLCAELMYGSPFERRQALADEAIAIARSSGDDATIVRVLHTVWNPAAVLLQQAMDWSAEALVRAERLGDPVLLFWAAWSGAGSAARALDIDEMDRCLEIMASRAAQLDQPILNWVHSWARGVRAQIAGDTEQAEQWAAEGLRIGTDSGQPDATFIYGAQLGPVHLQRGTFGELGPLLEQAAVDAPDFAGVIVAALALAHVEAGHIDDARRLLEQAAAADFDVPFDGNWLSTLTYYAEAAIACRDPKCSRTLFDRLAPWADQAPYPGLRIDSPVSYHLGGLATVLGRYDEADAYFARAAALNDRANAKFFAARTNLSWATMLAERNAPGDNKRARDLLTKAHTAAVAHGYAGIERRAAEALQHLA